MDRRTRTTCDGHTTTAQGHAGQFALRCRGKNLDLSGFAAHNAGDDALTCARIALVIARRRNAGTITGLYKGLGIA